MCVKQLGRQLTKKGSLCCHFSSKKALAVWNFLKDYDQLSFGFDLSKAVVEVWPKLYIPSMYYKNLQMLLTYFDSKKYTLKQQFTNSTLTFKLINFLKPNYFKKQ